MTQEPATHGIRNVVLVHGAFADGSGWRDVYTILTKSGMNVTVVQHPLTSLAADVNATKTALSMQDGPTILVGHSYGGAVITEAGTHPNVAGLVYVAAFAPDAGESVDSLKKSAPPGAAAPPILPLQNGFLVIDRAGFPEWFAADVAPETAAFMAAAQMPWSLEAVGGVISDPAWKHRPSWAIVATQDRMIPPDAQRGMAQRAGATIVELAGSHAIFVSQPKAVAAVIEDAAKNATIAAK